MEKEKPPIFGMVERGGFAIIRVLDNVRQTTIKPLIEKFISKKDTTAHTDEYSIYSKMEEWGYEHVTVNHSEGEYARDDDWDGFCEIHVNTIEGIWSLLRSWLRPHRGVSQQKLPLYVGFFEFVYNAARRGKNLLGSLLDTLLSPTPQY